MAASSLHLNLQTSILKNSSSALFSKQQKALSSFKHDQQILRFMIVVEEFIAMHIYFDEEGKDAKIFPRQNTPRKIMRGRKGETNESNQIPTSGR